MAELKIRRSTSRKCRSMADVQPGTMKICMSDVYFYNTKARVVETRLEFQISSESSESTSTYSSASKGVAIK